MKHNGLYHEAPLVFFTLLVQLSVGVFLASGLLTCWAEWRVGVETAGALTLPGFLAIVPVMGIALLASLLHLGTPQNAWRAVANLGSSWLSREITFSLLFAVSEALYALLKWLNTGAIWLVVLVGLATALSGSLAVYSMARVYLLRTVPSWNNCATLAGFAVSTLLLGSLGVAAALAVNPAARGDLLRLPLAAAGLLALGLLAVRVVWALLQAGGEQEQLWLVLQASLLSFALIVTSMLVYQSVVFDLSGRNSTLSWLAAISFVGALAEEAVGRILFYRSFQRVGI